MHQKQVIYGYHLTEQEFYLLKSCDNNVTTYDKRRIIIIRPYKLVLIIPHMT